MIASGNQNQLQSSLASLGDLLKTVMFLSNSNSFNSFPSPPVQGYNQRKSSSRVWKEKGSKWFYHFPLYPLVFVCISCVFCFILSQSSFYALLYLTCFCWLFFSFALFCFSYKNLKKKLKNKKNTKKVCVLCTLVLVYLGWPLKQNFLHFVSFVT